MIASRDLDDDPEDGDWDDEETDHGDAQEEADDEPTVPCPFCRREVFEDSPYCPSCERFISAEDHAASRKPLWVVVTALICLGIAIWWALAAR